MTGLLRPFETMTLNQSASDHLRDEILSTRAACLVAAMPIAPRSTSLLARHVRDQYGVKIAGGEACG